MTETPLDPFRTAAPPAPKPTPKYRRCPSCGELALPGTRRCEECRFDFVEDNAVEAWGEARRKHRGRALLGALVIATGMMLGPTILWLLSDTWVAPQPFGIVSLLIIVAGGRMMLRSIQRLMMLGRRPPASK